MFFELFASMAEDGGFFNLFRYQTFRTGGAIMTALILSFLLAKPMIRTLRARQNGGQPIRDDGPEAHLKKQGTPTMGGLMILLSVAISTLLWSDLSSLLVWAVLLITLGYGAIGFTDDYLKVSKRNTAGLRGKLKLLFQLLLALAALYLVNLHETLFVSDQTDLLKNKLALPFFKDVLIDLGWFFPVFAIIVVVGASNAVNLTDGLDGLAIVPVMVAAACFGLICYLVGRVDYTEYLQLHHVPGSGEIAIFCGALIGAALGFLWYNAPPAQIFMGDTGSLAMGGALGIISVIAKHEIVLAIVGGLFVLEAVSVMVQVASFKLTGKRVFRMAPIHHHFEKLGWSEPTIVIRFWIISFILALIGLATLKLR